ncbi:MAG: hypothetical protein GY802_19215 [Gammaproteobacteria bacterium]|nr:hypothetical protein [Gammaproteobacteria bacterium]
MSIEATLADDHESLRAGFRGLLETAADIEVVSEAGIGLALARRIIEFHGGKVWAEPAGPVQGSSFRFSLPFNQ